MSFIFKQAVYSNYIKLPEDLPKLKAELSRPFGKIEPVSCSMAPDGSLQLDFTPEEQGEHSIDVKKNGRPVQGSPFKVVVEEPIEAQLSDHHVMLTLTSTMLSCQKIWTN